MLLNYTDDYINTIENGRLLLGDIQFNLAQQEPYMGASKYLDKLYAQAIIISGIIDYFENNDHSNPREDEALLMCLREAIDKNPCKKVRNKTIDKTNYHVNPAPPTVSPYVPPTGIPGRSPYVPPTGTPTSLGSSPWNTGSGIYQ